MSEAVRPFPRGVLIAAAAMITITITAAATARLTGVGQVRVTEADASHVLELRFADRPDGAVEIYNAENNRLVDVVAPGNGGFIRTVMRSLVRERKLQDRDRVTPFRLVRWTDGRLSVADPTTGREVDLGAFGAPNTSAFAHIMVAGESTQ